uniref:Putative secreted protein n=1 Tax=Ixodes ricinus TaxID=34613 RepID=A0A6B0UAD5_IXORI
MLGCAGSGVAGRRRTGGASFAGAAAPVGAAACCHQAVPPPNRASWRRGLQCRIVWHSRRAACYGSRVATPPHRRRQRLGACCPRRR